MNLFTKVNRYFEGVAWVGNPQEVVGEGVIFELPLSHYQLKNRPISKWKMIKNLCLVSESQTSFTYLFSQTPGDDCMFVHVFNQDPYLACIHYDVIVKLRENG